MSPSVSILIIEIRVHAGSDAFNSTHGNIEQAVTSALQSVGHSDPRVNITHYKKMVDGVAKVVVHQRITDAGIKPMIGAGECTKAMESRIERALRKAVGYQPAVRFTRDAVPAPRRLSYENMKEKQFYARPNPGRNPATNGRQTQARM